MIQPRSLEIRDFPPNSKAWAIRGKSGRLLVVPDRRFPGRKPVRFFESQYDASRVRDVILGLKPEMEVHELEPVEVSLMETLRKLVTDKGNLGADSYVILNTTEVFDFITLLKQKAAD